MRFELRSPRQQGPSQWVTQWLLSAIGLALVARWVDGVSLQATGVEALLIVLGAAAVLGLLNLLLKPLLILITLPVNILTLGLFTLVINGIVLMACAALVPGFHIEGFGTSVWAAFCLSAISLVLGALVNGSSLRVDVQRGPREGG
jgi:putative membrane protein